jgi:hypothetical protein
MRKRGCVDENQPQLVRDLRRIPGVTVEVLSGLGKGVPDLLVGWQGRNYLLEVKNPAKPPSGQRLTNDEQEWHLDWRGQVAVVKTLADAVREMRIELKSNAA